MIVRVPIVEAVPKCWSKKISTSSKKRKSWNKIKTLVQTSRRRWSSSILSRSHRLFGLFQSRLWNRKWLKHKIFQSSHPVPQGSRTGSAWKPLRTFIIQLNSKRRSNLIFLQHLLHPNPSSLARNSQAVSWPRSVVPRINHKKRSFHSSRVDPPNKKDSSQFKISKS